MQSRSWAALLGVALASCAFDPSESPESPPEASAAQALSTISHRASTTAGALAATSLTIAKPAGTVAGDVLIARIANRNQVAAVLAAPSGWTVLRSDQSASQLKTWVAWKLATASEPASYAFAIDLASNLAGSISAFAGVDPGLGASVAAAAVAGVATALISRWWIGVLVAVASLVASRYTRGRLLLAAGAPVALALGALLDIPELGWVALGLLLADLVTGWWWQRRD